MTAAHRIIITTLVGSLSAISLSLFLPIPLKRPIMRRVLLGCVVFLILYLTILNRNSGIRSLKLEPFWSYAKWGKFEYRHEIIQNIIAFIPLGACLRSSFSRMRVWQIVIVCGLFSIAIEATQYIFALGLCETDDVINNTLGGLIGSLLYGKGENIISYVKQQCYGFHKNSSRR